MLPYVWTDASQGVLHGMNGFQDLTLAAKYNLLQTPFTKRGYLRAIVVGSLGAPHERLHARLPTRSRSGARAAALRRA